MGLRTLQRKTSMISWQHVGFVTVPLFLSITVSTERRNFVHTIQPQVFIINIALFVFLSVMINIQYSTWCLILDPNGVEFE